ncbi:MAG TPA: N-glycosylase, partial [Ignavibacteria bacterium]|nr:N-glycosylase [Ignavibacteria bacterium]
MNKLVKVVGNLKKSPIKKVVNKRMREFEELGKKHSNEIFKELCFCLMTANFNAEKSIKIQNEIDNKFMTLSLKNLFQKLKKLGHRFPNA